MVSVSSKSAFRHGPPRRCRRIVGRSHCSWFASRLATLRSLSCFKLSESYGLSQVERIVLHLMPCCLKPPFGYTDQLFTSDMCALNYVSLLVRSNTLPATAQVKSGRPSEMGRPSHHCIACSVISPPFGSVLCELPRKVKRLFNAPCH